MDEIIEQQESTEGWAVFSHCEGEEPQFVESPEEGLFAANHYDDEIGLVALSSFSRIDFERWTVEEV